MFRKRSAIVAGDPPLPRRARLPRGRDADDAFDPRRRGGAPVRHPPQRARPGPLHAHRARAVPEAAGGRRLRARLRDRPQLPQRGAVAPAQPRVHDARVLSGVRDVRGPDGADRDAVPGAGARGGGRRGADLPGAGGQPGVAVAAHPDEGRDRRRVGARPAARRASSGRCWTTVAALSKWIEASGVGARGDELAAVLRKSDAHGERVGALFDYAGEKTLPADRPAFVTEYPAETSPLSRRNDRDPTPRRPLRAVHRRPRARQRVLRAERPRRSARPLRAPGRRQGAGARGDDGLRRGLLPRARVRDAADGGRGHRHRSADHAALPTSRRSAT